MSCHGVQCAWSLASPLRHAYSTRPQTGLVGPLRGSLSHAEAHSCAAWLIASSRPPPAAPRALDALQARASGRATLPRPSPRRALQNRMQLARCTDGASAEVRAHSAERCECAPLRPCAARGDTAGVSSFDAAAPAAQLCCVGTVITSQLRRGASRRLIQTSDGRQYAQVDPHRRRLGHALCRTRLALWLC